MARVDQGGDALGQEVAARQAPPKADAAPKAQTTFTGLCEALNSTQIELVKQGIYTYPNTYSIEFKTSPDGKNIGQAKVKLEGTVNHAMTPMSPADQARAQLRQSINTAARRTSVIAGTSILQQIEKVIRNSQYIADQANTSRQEDGSTPSQVPPGQLVWYNITMGAIQKQFDPKRNDYAYEIKFLITPFDVPQIDSEYFPRGEFRGVHKEYDYWFTGKNTEVIAFEQELNTNWFTVIGRNDPTQGNKAYAASNPTDIRRRLFAPATDVNNQGAENEAMQAGASAASALFNERDFARARLTIMGDPAWIMQHEIVYGANADAFEFTPFNADGGVNTGVSQVLFTINWNTIQDYNLDTGLMQVNSYNQNRSTGSAGTPQYSVIYGALQVTSTFSKGKFTQALEGQRYYETYTAPSAAAKPPAKPPATVPDAPKIRTSDQRAQAIQQNMPGFSQWNTRDPDPLGTKARAAASRLTKDEAANILASGDAPAVAFYGGRRALEEKAGIFGTSPFVPDEDLGAIRP